jgi:succinate dehydrogenase / fumarate reductase iron-sulfur subunit
MKVNLKIYRFDPDSKEPHRYSAFKIELPEGETVLSALVKIYEEFDPGLSFRFACGKIKCGECAVMVNKAPCLACDRLIEPEMVIEPLPNLPVIKDLVIDKNKALRTAFEMAPSLVDLTRPAYDEADLQIIDEYIRFTGCFECLICQSTCPILKKQPGEFPGPLGLLWLVQRKLTFNEKNDIGEIVQPCTECGRCWQACPAEKKFLEPAITGLLDDYKPDRVVKNTKNRKVQG